jgi:hypothetical protein
MRHLEQRGLYERQTGRNRPWTDREARVLVATTVSRRIRYAQLELRSTEPTMRSHQEAHRLGLSWRPKRRDR